MTVAHSLQKYSTEMKISHSSVIHLRIRYSVSSPVQMSSTPMVRKLSGQEHLLPKKYCELFSNQAPRRYQFVLYSHVSVKKVYVRSVMVLTLQRLTSSLLVLQLVSLLLSQSVNQVLSLLCVHSTRDELQRKVEISRQVSRVSKNSSKHAIQNTLLRLLHLTVRLLPSNQKEVRSILRSKPSKNKFVSTISLMRL